MREPTASELFSTWRSMLSPALWLAAEQRQLDKAGTLHDIGPDHYARLAAVARLKDLLVAAALALFPSKWEAEASRNVL